MIAQLTGVLIEKNPPQIVLDVHGVGYEVEVPMSTFYNLPELTRVNSKGERKNDLCKLLPSGV
jgi:Holliday junction resolvasome RuvABC DNA-binding subunit